MKKEIINFEVRHFFVLLVALYITIGVEAQENSRNLSFGFTGGIVNTPGSERISFDQYTGYNVENDQTNYKIGLFLEYKLRKGFAFNTAINYLKKDFTRTYYCDVCDFSEPPLPQDTHFRFLEIPVSLRYYFLPRRLRLFGEVGLNNIFLLNDELTDEVYVPGVQFGGGIEYNFSQEIALQIGLNYNKGMTAIFDRSAYKINYASLGFTLMKRR